MPNPPRRRFIAVVGTGLALAVGAALAVWSLLGGFTRTQLRYVASAAFHPVLAAATALYDPYADVADSPICNCSSDIPYRCEDPAHPYALRLRADPRFAALLAEPPHRIETWAALMHTLRESFEPGKPSGWRRHGSGHHVLERLDDAARGERFLCRDASIMLAELVGAAGGFARLVALLADDGRAHVVTEIWVEEAEGRGRWVVFDPDFDVWFSAPDGTPLSALDLHRLAIANRPDEAIAHAGGSPNSRYDAALHPHLIATYAHLSFGTQANWISTDLPPRHPRRHPREREDLWVDGAPSLPPIYYRALIDDEERLYFTPCRPWRDDAP